MSRGKYSGIVILKLLSHLLWKNILFLLGYLSFGDSGGVVYLREIKLRNNTSFYCSLPENTNRLVNLISGMCCHDRTA